MYATPEDLKRLEKDFETLREIFHHVRKEKKYMHTMHMKMMSLREDVNRAKHTKLIEDIEKTMKKIGQLEDYIESAPDLKTDLHEDSSSISSQLRELVVHMIEEGHSKENIRKYLIEHRWPKEMIDGIMGSL